MAKHELVQAAVIPVRVRSGRIEVALVTSLRRRRWIIPKGRVERGETLIQAATREAEEEAGVRGTITSKPIGVYRVRKDCRVWRVKAFLMWVDEVLDDWPEAERRKRAWMEPRDARERAHPPGLRRLLAEVLDPAGVEVEDLVATGR